MLYCISYSFISQGVNRASEQEGMMDFSWVQIKTHSHLVFQSFIVECCIFGEQNMAASLARVFANEYSNHFPSGVSNAEAPGHLSCSRRKNLNQNMGTPNPHLLHGQGQSQRWRWSSLAGKSWAHLTGKGRVETRRGRKKQDGRGGKRTGSHRSLEVAIEAARTHTGLRH